MTDNSEFSTTKSASIMRRSLLKETRNRNSTAAPGTVGSLSGDVKMTAEGADMGSKKTADTTMRQAAKTPFIEDEMAVDAISNEREASVSIAPTKEVRSAAEALAYLHGGLAPAATMVPTPSVKNKQASQSTPPPSMIPNPAFKPFQASKIAPPPSQPDALAARLRAAESTILALVQKLNVSEQTNKRMHAEAIQRLAALNNVLRSAQAHITKLEKKGTTLKASSAIKTEAQSDDEEDDDFDSKETLLGPHPGKKSRRARNEDQRFARKGKCWRNVIAGKDVEIARLRAELEKLGWVEEDPQEIMGGSDNRL